MCNIKQMHATLVDCGGKGVLLQGKSGSGKSDLALRLIAGKGAQLVADDMVNLRLSEKGELIGEAPENLRGLLEVRGVGVVKYDFAAETKIKLAVNLVPTPEEVERMPKDAHENILGVEIAKIDLYAKENSAPEKVWIKLFGRVVNDETI